MTLHRIIRAAWLIAALLFVGAVAHQAATGSWRPFWEQGGMA